MTAAAILVLSFAPADDGRGRAERLVEDLLVEHDLGEHVGGGQDLVTGDFDLEVATTDAERLLKELKKSLAAEPELALKDAVLIERSQ